MPIRIYALAKDLQIDSKDLVDICTKAGITGKGSALASLTDEEVVKLKAFMAGPSPAAGAGGGAVTEARPRVGLQVGRSTGLLSSRRGAATGPTLTPPAPISRDDYIAPSGTAGKIKVIGTRRPAALKPAPPTEPTPAPTAPAPTTPGPDAVELAPDEPSVPSIAAASTATPPPGLDAPEREPAFLRTPERAEASGIKIIGGPKRRADAGERRPKRRAPVINVAPAPMPEAKQPSATAKPTEPKTQKPEIRLPKEALTHRKGQRRPPLEHLAERKPKKETKRAPAPEVFEEESPEAAVRRAASGRRVARPDETPDAGMAGMASARADRKARRATRKVKSTTLVNPREGEAPAPRRRKTLIHKGTNTAAPRKGKVALELPCTVRSFSETAGVSAMQVQKALMGMGLMLTINSVIENEYVEMLAAELGVDLELKAHATLEDEVIAKLRDADDAPEDLQPRPPVVTFLGHVDHGKTSLLDYLIGTNVVAGEAGGITQHIRAYQIKKGNRAIAFVDTPGHEAFTEMRARGAHVTDIAVLVVAADDGIMPQTEEAISHAKAAGVPIVVALNKIDLPGVDPNRIMTQMTEYGLTPSQWGGETEVVPTSAVTGQGMDELLETILTVADLNEYQANPDRPAIGTCLEAEQEGARGVIAKLIVQQGTLRVGDVVLCGSAFGRVKAMYDTLQRTVKLQSAGPSTPVNVTGFDAAPQAGDPFYVLPDIAQARSIADQRHAQSRQRSLAGVSIKVSFDEFQRRLAAGRLAEGTERVVLNLIIRADVRGSIEAIQKELSKLEHPEVQVKILQASVGGITVADVTLAHASQAVIIGFNVIPDEAARALSEERQVEIRRYDVIYKVTDDIRALLEGKLKPEERVVELGQALVKQVFAISRVGAIAGCYVVRGSIERGCRIRVNRDGRTIGDYPLESLRREKDDVKEVSRGLECGIKLSGFNDVKKDDVLEAYKIEEFARTL
ncbi:MAG: translation initiation factor IF-2 [Pirellulaceae bacterium]|nr:translation initiation factor IF-2 [Pirellulaceae bacterium]